MRGAFNQYIKMTSTDKILIEASKHFSLTASGELSRDSWPYDSPHRGDAPLGTGFDCRTGRYFQFTYTRSKGAKKRSIISHRMIFYLVHGYLPEEVDHIDENKHNNHPLNLRAATRSQNKMNVRVISSNSTGYIGVCKHRNKWQASITVKGKQTHLGLFSNRAEAASHYNLAAIELHGEFANFNDVRA